MQKLTVSLTERQIKQLRDLKRQSGLTVSELIRRALDQVYPAKPEKGGLRRGEPTSEGQESDGLVDPEAGSPAR